MSFKTLTYLFYLTPLLLISGPFLPDLTVVMIAFYSLYILITKKLPGISNGLKFTFYYFMAFYFYIILRSSFSDDPLLSYESSLFYFRFILYIFGIVYFFLLDDRLLKRLSIVALFSIIVLSIDSIIELTTGFRIIGENSPGIEHGRLSSFFGTELIMGSFLVKMLPFSLICIHYYYDKIEKKYLYLLVALLLLIIYFTIYVSGERTALLNGLLFLVIIIFTIPSIKTLSKVLILGLSFVLISLSITSFKDSSSKRFMMTFDQTIKKNNKIYIFSPEHESHIKTALRMFGDNILFGQGSKMFRNLCSDPKFEYVITMDRKVMRSINVRQQDIFSNGCSTHPHHMYVQILSENGLIGLLFFLILIGYLIKKVYFSIINKHYLLTNKFFPIFILASSLLIIFNPFLPNNNIFNNWISCVIYLKLGLLIAMIEKNKFKGTT